MPPIRSVPLTPSSPNQGEAEKSQPDKVKTALPFAAFKVKDMVDVLGIQDDEELIKEVKTTIRDVMRETYDPCQTFLHQPEARRMFDSKVTEAYPLLLVKNRKQKLDLIGIHLARQFGNWRHSVLVKGVSRSKTPAVMHGLASRPSSPSRELEVYTDHIVPMADPGLSQFGTFHGHRRSMTSAPRPFTPVSRKHAPIPRTPMSMPSTSSRAETFAEWIARGSVPPTPAKALDDVRGLDIAGTSASQHQLFLADASPTPAPGVRNMDTDRLDEILHFLRCCKPPMVRLLPAFARRGCNSLEWLSAVTDWEPDEIFKFFLTLTLPKGCGKPVTEMEALVLQHHLTRFFNHHNGSASRPSLCGSSSNN